MSSIVVATSIPRVLSRRNAGRPIDSDYQKLCLRSWFDCGFSVVSVNHPDEIAGLAAMYPEVSFIATNRDASAVSGRRTPYLADLLRALIDGPGPVVGIVNSDLVFEPSPAWRTWLPRAAGEAVVTGQRHDATSLFSGTFRKYYWGFDFFFFDVNSARHLVDAAMPFAMGLAWWDYWLPAALSLAGRRIVTLERPTVAHLIHKEPQLDDSWRELAISFATFVVTQAAKHGRVLPPSIGPVLPLCRELAQMPELRWRHRGADAEIGQMAVHFIPAITRNFASVPLDGVPSSARPSDEMSPGNVFHRFEDRLSAGEALERGKQLEREGHDAQASSSFLYAFERTPNDCDLLSAFGEFRLRQGDTSAAIVLLRKAVESEPENRATYGPLAIALYQSGQRPDAMKVLEGALARWPEFPEARQLMATFGQGAQRP
jgi:hypothetical protein